VASSADRSEQIRLPVCSGDAAARQIEVIGTLLDADELSSESQASDAGRLRAQVQRGGADLLLSACIGLTRRRWTPTRQLVSLS
jgi:hypothetical protein